MRTARFPSSGRSAKLSCRQTPLDADLPPLESRPPHRWMPCHVTCGACWEANKHPPPNGENDRHVKTLPCPKLRLRAIKIRSDVYDVDRVSNTRVI